MQASFSSMMKIYTSKEAFGSEIVRKTAGSGNQRPAPFTAFRPLAATQSLRTSSGTQRITTGGTKKITTIEVFSKEKKFRDKKTVSKRQPKILSNVQQLRLLSKLEEAGLLSLLEKNGVTLSAIEKSGLLSTAENLGLLSAATDPSTPTALFGLATALLAAGPAVVYFVPDNSTGLVAAQVVAALLCTVGGSAAFGGAQLLSKLQK